MVCNHDPPPKIKGARENPGIVAHGEISRELTFKKLKWCGVCVTSSLVIDDDDTSVFVETFAETFSEMVST